MKIFTGQEIKILGYSIKMYENSQKISKITQKHFLSLNNIPFFSFEVLFCGCFYWEFYFLNALICENKYKCNNVKDKHKNVILNYQMNSS